MGIRGAIVAFCCALIGGIAVSMLLPDAAVSPFGAASVGGAVAVLAGVAGLRWRRGDGGAARAGAAALATAVAIAGLTAGIVRHRSAISSPDEFVAVVQIEAGRARMEPSRPMTGPGRLRVRLQSPPSSELAVRLIGDVDARLPADGDAATADETGRWRFRIATVAVTSDVVRFGPTDATGREVVTFPAMSRLRAVEVVEGNSTAVVSVHRLSSQIGVFARPAMRQPPLRILGFISGDPLVYDYKTVLPVTPQYVEWPSGGGFLPVEGGLLQVTVRPELAGYADLSGTDAYGRLVEVRGVLQAPAGARNPGGFDMRRHLRNSGVQALVFAEARGAGDPTVRLVAVGKRGGAPHRNSAVAFSLDLRDRLTRVIKATIPYPQSAFVGGVTLGLRYGLQNVACLLHRPDPAGGAGGGCPEFISEEFRAAGISHVLAVSGLHVTIITVMFVGLFSLARMPRQVYTPLILVALVIFAIVTGARPSTLRAVIMNGLMLSTWAYLRADLRASVLLGAPVAAALILIHNPLVATDPSFTLSFGAILSLGLLTSPILELLQTLRGWRLAAVLGWGALVAAVSALKWPLAASPQFLLFAAAAGAAVVGAAVKLDRGGRCPLPAWFAFDRLPPAVGAFLSAQGAIQIGMMLPLSAYYFCRWPLAGAWANLVAIPLIGVIVQLGAIGGLTGLIPGVGLFLALPLGAANWLSSSLFLLLGHGAAAAFPYPFLRRPGGIFLLCWYALCALWVWRRPLGGAMCAVTDRRGWPRWVVRLAAGAAAATLAVVGARDIAYRPAGVARLTFMAVEYGGATLIESPGGRRILVDSGFADPDRGYRNQAIRNILPYLASRKIRALDALVLTSPRPERAAGAAWLLQHLWIGEVVVPPSMAGLSTHTGQDALAASFGVPLDSPLAMRIHAALIGDDDRYARPSLIREIDRRRDTWSNRLSGWQTRMRVGSAGDVLLREDGPGGEFIVEAIHPAATEARGLGMDDGSLVLRVAHGGRSVLLAGDLAEQGVRTLTRRVAPDRLAAEIVTAPHHGAPPTAETGRSEVEEAIGRVMGQWLEATGARAVIAEYGYASGVPGGSPRQREMAAALARQAVEQRVGADAWFATSEGALVVESDGRGWRGPRRAGAMGGDDDEAPPDFGF